MLRLKIFKSKRSIEMSLKTIVGLVLLTIIFFAFIGFFMKLWGIFLVKPDEASLNSFENLMHEINTITQGQEKVVPYYIKNKLYLRSECAKGLSEDEYLDDLCICTANCDKRLIRKFVDKKVAVETKDLNGGTLSNGLTGDDVNNLYLFRSDEGICIYDSNARKEKECKITK